VYDEAGAFKSLSERWPSASARSAQTRAALWSVFLHFSEQNFFEFAPTVLAENGDPHQKQDSKVFMRSRPSTIGVNDAHMPQGTRGLGLTPPHPWSVTAAVHPNVPAGARQEW
jgi:hypothetical protein